MEGIIISTSNTVFSIIVPIYNAAQYLEKCIDSILNQSFEDFELILVDDESPDNCGEIIENYAEKDDRIKTIHQKNGGIVSARIAGTKLARGDYIISVDADDWLAFDSLKIIYEKIVQTKADAVYFGYYEWNDKNYKSVLPNYMEGLYEGKNLDKLKKAFFYDKDSRFYSFGINPSAWSKAIKREIYTKYQLKVNKDIVIAEDCSLIFPIMLEISSLYVIREKLYNYRVVDKSMSRGLDVKELYSISLMLDYFKSYDIRDYKSALGAYTINVLYNHFHRFAKRKKKYREYRQQIKCIPKVLLEFTKYYKIEYSKARAVLMGTLIRHRMWFIIWCLSKLSLILRK